MPFSLSEVVNDPDLGQPFTIYRSKGQYGPSGWETVGQPQQISTFGVIGIAEDRDMQQVPEGDRIDGSLQVYTGTRLLVTEEDSLYLSDQIKWHGKFYKLVRLGPWEDFSYDSAIMVRTQGS